MDDTVAVTPLARSSPECLACLRAGDDIGVALTRIKEMGLAEAEAIQAREGRTRKALARFVLQDDSSLPGKSQPKEYARLRPMVKFCTTKSESGGGSIWLGSVEAAQESCKTNRFSLYVDCRGVNPETGGKNGRRGEFGDYTHDPTCHFFVGRY